LEVQALLHQPPFTLKRPHSRPLGMGYVRLGMWSPVWYGGRLEFISLRKRRHPCPFWWRSLHELSSYPNPAPEITGEHRIGEAKRLPGESTVVTKANGTYPVFLWPGGISRLSRIGIALIPIMAARPPRWGSFSLPQPEGSRTTTGCCSLFNEPEAWCPP